MSDEDVYELGDRLLTASTEELADDIIAMVEFLEGETRRVTIAMAIEALILAAEHRLAKKTQQ